MPSPFRLRSLCLAAGLAVPLLLLGTGARAEVLARVNIVTQQMTVFVDGVPRYDWPVSTARRGYVTPTGTFRPTRMHTMWHSRKYDNAPMPFSVFFHGGYAVHGTQHVRALGTPASHGCVRLATDNARTLYSLVSSEGMGNVSIVITR